MRFIFKERLSTGIYAICLKKQDSRFPEIYYYDFTSLYPAMATKDLPFDIPVYIQGSQIDINNFFGFIKCKVTTKNMNLKPLHAKMEAGKLIFKYLDNDEIVLFSEEIKLGLQNNQYEYKFIDGYQFKHGKVLNEMCNDVFKLKADAKKQGKDALSLVWKIILNSSYGFWGLRTHDRDSIKIYNLGDAPVASFAENNKLKAENDVGNYRFICLSTQAQTTLSRSF